MCWSPLAPMQVACAPANPKAEGRWRVNPREHPGGTEQLRRKVTARIATEQYVRRRKVQRQTIMRRMTMRSSVPGCEICHGERQPDSRSPELSAHLGGDSRRGARVARGACSMSTSCQSSRPGLPMEVSQSGQSAAQAARAKGAERHKSRQQCSQPGETYRGCC